MATKKLKGGNLTLYHRGDSKYWYASYKLESGGRIQESTKKEREHEAMGYAMSRYEEIRFRDSVGLTSKTVKFSAAADAWLTEIETEITAGNRKARQLTDYKPIVERYLKPYFGKKNIDTISQGDMNKYRAWRRDYWITGPGKNIDEITYVRDGKTLTRKLTHTAKAPSARSINTENVVLRGIFAYAEEQGWVSAVHIPKPKGAKVKASDSRARAYPIFEVEEYVALRRHMTKWIKDPNIKEEERWRREAIQDCLLILFNSGLRENELHKRDERTHEMRGLRWCDVDYFISASGIRLAELSVDGKTGPRKVIPQRALEYVLKRRKNERCPQHTQQDYVLAYPDGTLINSFDSGVRRLLAAAGLLKCPRTGKNRGIYSCRHSYATWRLRAGAKPLELARNMGNSTTMMDNHYYHHSSRASADSITGKK